MANVTQNKKSEYIDSPTTSQNISSSSAAQPYPGLSDFKKCKIDMIDIMNKMNILNESMQLIKQSDNFDKLISTLLSDNFYNNIATTSKLLNDYNFGHFQCLLENAPRENANPRTAKEIYCGFSEHGLVTADKLEKIANVVDKYESLIKMALQKSYLAIQDSRKYCGTDIQMSEKLKKLMSKMGIILVDEDTITKNCLSRRTSLKKDICSDIIPASLTSCTEYKTDTCKDVVASLATCNTFKTDMCKDIEASALNCAKFKANICEDSTYGHIFDAKGYFVGYIGIFAIILCIILIIFIMSRTCNNNVSSE